MNRDLKKCNLIPTREIVFIPCCANCKWCETQERGNEIKHYCLASSDRPEKRLYNWCETVCEWWELAMRYNREFAKTMVIENEQRNKNHVS